MAKMIRQMAEFGAILGRECPKFSAYAVACYACDLKRMAKRADTLAVALCNGAIEQDVYDRREAALTKRAAKLLAELGPGFSAHIGGDPRGCVFKLTVPSGATNDFGREAVCVPY